MVTVIVAVKEVGTYAVKRAMQKFIYILVILLYKKKKQKQKKGKANK
jgi:hypothetical protein